MCATERLKADLRFPTWPADHNSPPFWDQRTNWLHVFFRYDDRGAIEHCTVKLDLLLKPVQGVFVAFNFMTDQPAVNQSNIRATFAMSQSEFVDHQDVRGGMIPAQNLPMEVLAYDCVVHDQCGSIVGRKQVLFNPSLQAISKRQT
jgi:hypothetical protein